MLKFVIGTAGTGKSTYISNKIISLAQNGEKCLFLIPEQFSKTGEAMIFSSLDNAQANLVELFSFTSLLRDVQNNHAKINATPLSEAGKAVIAHQSINNVKNQLSLYNKQSQNFGFSFNLAGTFDDLKRSGISSEIFYDLAKKAPEKSAKLKELSLIYAEYCGLMGNKYCDNEDLLEILSQSLPEIYTYNTNIFIDSFESFSYGQLRVIEKMLTNAKSVTIALTCDSLYDTTNGTGNFSFVQNTASQLINIAKKLNVQIEKPLVLRNNYRFHNEDLINIDMFLQDISTKKCESSHAFVNKFDTQFSEVCYTAAKINNLIKSGYSYNDIAVVCPQLDKYENQLQESFSLAKIPYFIDANRIISSCAPVVLFRSIMDIMANGLNSETIMPLLKTGLTNFEEEAISMLENYLFVWQDYNFDFNIPFNLSPGGLKPEIEDNEKEYIKRIDFIRSELINIFYSNENSNFNTASDILKTCYDIVLKLGSDEKLTNIINEMSNHDDKELLSRQWETAIDCLNQLYTIIGEDKINAEDIQTLFMLIVQGEEIGFAPETQDCVMITDPKRMKLDSIKVIFILGAAQDVFPAIVSEGGLISLFDREYLKENNYPLKNNFENLFSFENLYYYKALTNSQDFLFISCPEKNIDTTQILSAQVETLCENLNIPEDTLPLEDYAITKEFFSEYISHLATNQNREQYIHILSQLDINAPVTKVKDYAIHDLNFLEQLLGDSITLSPTGVQSYYQCAFMYFLQRVLKVKPLEKVQLSAKLAGDYLHFIAHNVMEKYGENYYSATWEEIQKNIDEAIQVFIKENYPATIYNDVKFSAQHENMRENANQLLEYIYNEQNESLFRPIAFEEKIGMNGRIPPLTVSAKNNKKANIVGVRDRIDIYRGKEKDYLRIVDYKTGTQDFSLDDIFNGLSSQLLLYMNALLQAEFGKKDKDLQAGAVVYQPADAQFKFDKDDETLYTAVGMALSSPEISEAFDRSAQGRFGVLSGDEKIKANKGSEIAGEKKFNIVLDYVKEQIVNMTNHIYNGDFDCMPLEKKNGQKPCSWCRFYSICQNENKSKLILKNQFSNMEKEKNNGI